MKLIILITVFLAISFIALAEGKTVMGTAAISCGSWTQEAKKESIMSSVYQVWALGFVSGNNFASDKKDFLLQTDTGGITGWIDKYCAENPLSTIGQAAILLTTELKSKNQ